MAEPARKMPVWEIWTPLGGAPDEEPGIYSVLQRWVERPDGQVEFLELPLTPELFLDPQLEDKMVQGSKHFDTVMSLYERLRRQLRSRQDVTVLSDLKHLLGPGLSAPAPDISIIRGLPDPTADMESYNLVRWRIAPCLIIEVVSPSNTRVRHTDEVAKVSLYERTGVQEYLLIDLPRRGNEHRYRMKGYRLDSEGSYQPLDPDSQGRFVSETTDLAFAVSPASDEIDIFDLLTGERIWSPIEEAEGRKAAEKELARLRAEIDRLKPR